MSVTVTTGDAKCVYMAPRPNTMQDGMVLPVSGPINALPTVPIPILVANLSF